MSAISRLEPRALWNHFCDLNAVPRASKKETQVIQWMRNFGEQLDLPTLVDDIGNVIIKKPASAQCKGRTPIVMQAHLDMVHQKNADVDFDFATQGIDMILEGDWVSARGTTLGADNGIGVATIMAVLSSDSIEHPALEALFTIDEETGMTGAQGLKGGLLEGRILLNLDTEDDDELTIGCAGGVDVTAEAAYPQETIPDQTTAYRLSVTGLTGGHSGVDIHLGRGNANKLMNRLIWNLAQEMKLQVAKIDGGGLRNAIPRESFAIVAIRESDSERLQTVVDRVAQDVRREYQETDPQAAIGCEQCPTPERGLASDFQSKLLATLYACHNGIYRMSPSIPELVQTSNNLARVSCSDGNMSIQCLTRSSVNSERDDLANALQANFALLGGNVTASGAYPGWKPAPDSTIVRLMSDIYAELFGQPPHVSAVHAGLECGILGQNYPNMDMVSFGPNIRGAHSPDERVQVSSVQKFWEYLIETLRRIP